MKKVLLTVLGLVVILVGAALAAPSFVDWNAYKDDISAAVREQTGRELDIQGDIKATLLPAPAISAENIRLSNRQGAVSEDMLSLSSVRVQVAFAPLLSRVIQVDSFELVEPVVDIEKFADGSMNFDDIAAAAAKPSTEAAPAQESAPVNAGNGSEPLNIAGFDLKIDGASIKDGTVIYRDSQAGTMQVVDNFNLTVGANSLQGPFDLAGDINLIGIPLAFEAGVGEYSPDRAAIPVTMSIDIDGGATRTNLTGALIGLQGDNPGIRGKLRGGSDNILKLLTALGVGDGLPAELAKPLSIDASVSASATEAKVEEIVLEAAGSRITGDARVALGDIIDGTVDLHVGRLDLDALLASLPAGTGDAAAKQTDDGSAEQAKKPSDTPATGGAAAVSGPVTLPKDINLAANFTAEAILYRGKPINQANVSIALANGELSINQISAQLPGTSDFAMFGFLAPAGNALGVELETEARSDNLRALLEWAGVDLSTIPAGKLQTVSLRTKVGGTTENIRVNDLDLKLDSMSLRAAAVLRPSPRPGAGVTVRIDRLDLDGYLPKQAAAPVQQPAATQPAQNADAGAAGAPAKADDPFAALAALNDFDLNTDIGIATLTYDGITARDIVLKSRLVNGKLEISQASVGDIAGASANLKGNFSNFGKVLKIDGLEAGLKARSIDGLLRLAGTDSPIPPEKLGAVSAGVTANGDLNQLQVNASVKAAGGSASARGAVSPLGAVDDLNLAVIVDHPSLNKLLDVVAPDYKPEGRNLGPLAVKAGVAIKPQQIAVKDLNAKVGPVSVAGNASVATGGVRPMITARLSASELPAQLFMPVSAGPSKSASGSASSSGGSTAQAAGNQRWSRAPLDTSGLRLVDADVRIDAKAVLYEQYRVDNPEIVLTLKDGRLDLSRMAGRMFGGGFDMTAIANAGEKLDAQARIAVENANIKQAVLQTAGMDVADGTLNFTADLTTGGRSEYDLVRGLNGSANLKVTDGVANGFDLDALSEKLNNIGNIGNLLNLITQGISGGQTRFSNLAGSFKITNGVVETNNLNVTAKSGTANTGARADLADWTLDGTSVVQLTGISGAPPINVRFRGPLDKPNPTFDINAFQAFILANGLVKGVGGIVKGGKDIIKDAGGGVGGVVKGILGTIGGQQNQTSGSGSQTTQPSGTTGGSTPPPPPPQQQPAQQNNNPLQNILKGVLGN